jgi:hypothetical protein
MWARKPKGEADLRESRRWTEGYERIAELAAQIQGTRLVYVADREGDLRELLDRAADLDHAADYLIRAKHDRALADGGKLRAELEGHRPPWAKWSSPCRRRRDVRPARSSRPCGRPA